MIPLIETLEINIWLKLLIDATMKSVVIFAVAGLFGFILRHRSAAVRGLVWSLAILGCLIVPLFSLTLPQWEVGVLPATPEGFEADRWVDNRQAATSPVPIVERPLSTTATSSTQTTPIPIQPVSTPSQIATPQSNTWETGLASFHWTDWIAMCWVGGALYLLARLFVGIGAVWHLSNRSHHSKGLNPHLPPNQKRSVSVRQNEAVTVPMVWGLFRPVILLPADAEEWSSEQQRAVLLHELAHIQRQDWLMQMMAQITCAVCWFNPLVWFAARRMRTEVERACADHVLNAGHQSTAYAQHLLDIVRNIKTVRSISRATVAMARPSKIEGRLQAILSGTRNRKPMTKIVVVIGVLTLTCFAVPMGVMQLAEAVDPEQALYQEIQAVYNFRPDPLPENPTEVEQAARRDQYQQKWERGLQLCEQFLNTHSGSDQYDEVLYNRLIYVRNLSPDAEFDAGVEAFFSEHPTSKYASKVRKLRAYHLENQFKFQEALAEWDKVDDPALLAEVYERKGLIHGRMDNWVKRAEFDLLRAELILGKPAPEFSHTSVYGVPVSLKDLRDKVIVLYHWSTRDGRTMRDSEKEGEISKLKQLHKTHGENPNFVLITVCTQSSETKLKQFIETHAMPGIHLLLEHEAVPYQFGVTGWPYYVVIDKAGILRESEHGYALSDLEVENLVEALLAEDIDVPGERIIPRISQRRADLADFNDEETAIIAEYEKLLAFMPNTPHIMWEIRYRKFKLMMAELYRKRPESGDATAWMNQAYEQIVEESRASPNLGMVIVSEALELATFCSQQGDPEKTWALFQIAVTHDDEDNINSAVDYAKEKPERFAAIQDMPEFQKLMAETPLTEADKRSNEANRKREMYADDLSAALKSFVAVKADGEIFTGVVLSQVGHILVPANVTEAETIRAKISDYHPAKVVAADSESGLAIVQVNGQTDLRPVVLGKVDDLREYVPIPLPNPEDGYTYPSITVISTRGYPNYPNLPPEIHQRAVEHPIGRSSGVMQLEINDDGKVGTLTVASPFKPGTIIRGDALVYHDGRLLAVSVDNEVRYDVWGATANPLPIDQIRAALERMNMMSLIESHMERPVNGSKKGTTQLYQPYTSSSRTTPTSRLDSFTYTLTTLQQFGGGEVIFEGGTGFVRFQVRKDGSLVAMVPVSATILHISSNTPLARMSLQKKYYTIRLTSRNREQLGQMAAFQNAEERAIPYPKTDPHIFLEADVGSDISVAAELTEAVLTKVFQVKKGMITTFGGDYHDFRSSAPLGR
jgi:beta-lactamase regulating signal transducer with metallopeptidase domain/peroxiredoxin